MHRYNQFPILLTLPSCTQEVLCCILRQVTVVVSCATMSSEPLLQYEPQCYEPECKYPDYVDANTP